MSVTTREKPIDLRFVDPVKYQTLFDGWHEDIMAILARSSDYSLEDIDIPPTVSEDITPAISKPDSSKEHVPIYHKLALTVTEASQFSNIGKNRIDALLRMPNCPFALYIGTKKLVKRKEFEEYISRTLQINFDERKISTVSL